MRSSEFFHPFTVRLRDLFPNIVTELKDQSYEQALAFFFFFFFFFQLERICFVLLEWQPETSAYGRQDGTWVQYDHHTWGMLINSKRMSGLRKACLR